MRLQTCEQREMQEASRSLELDACIYWLDEKAQTHAESKKELASVAFDGYREKPPVQRV